MIRPNLQWNLPKSSLDSDAAPARASRFRVPQNTRRYRPPRLLPARRAAAADLARPNRAAAPQSLAETLRATIHLSCFLQKAALQQAAASSKASAPLRPARKQKKLRERQAIRRQIVRPRD